ncbi:MAG TPA: hypothetical protein VN033_15355 [Vulgatibacter sp.]|nr:hypothetical protein [Vulgatibacter sp.]
MEGRDSVVGPGAGGKPAKPGEARGREGEARGREEGLTPSEQPVMADGQLGGGNLDRGPERANPEGTADTQNPPTERS